MRTWRGIGMVEGQPTGDGRFVEEGALTWAEPPLPLTWQKASADGHDGEVIVGSVDTLTRSGNKIVGTGSLLDTPEATEVGALIQQGLVGLSASLDDSTEAIVPVDENGDLIPEGDARLSADLAPSLDPAAPPPPHVEPQMRVSQARIRNFCICTTPAFVECTIELADGTMPSDGTTPPPPGADAQQCPPGQEWDPALGKCVATQPAPPPPQNASLVASAVPSHSTATTNGPWDGAAAEAALGDTVGDKGPLEYAWRDPAGDPDTKAAWKFPHHEVGANGQPGAANTQATAAIMASVHGGRGGTTIPSADKPGVFNHAARHAKDAGLEPPAYTAGPDAWADWADEAGFHTQAEEVRHVAAVTAGACCLACQSSGGSCAGADLEPVSYTPSATMQAEARRAMAWRKAGAGNTSTATGLLAAELAAGHPMDLAAVKRLFAYFARHDTHRDDDGWRQGDPTYPTPGRMAWSAHGGDAGYQWARRILESTEGAAAVTVYATQAAQLVAAAAPAAPPAAWFSDPGLDGPTPLTVTPEGRVYGHLAPWNSCHMSVAERCLTPPHSSTGYAHFHQGRVRTAEGILLSCGKITAGGLHAAISDTEALAVEHYEHTAWVAADVRAGEDAYGIWVAGAVRPGLTAAQMTSLERGALSGDWRRVRGVGLELCAALAVNVPGFPVVEAQVAGGAPAALVASGVVEADRRDRALIPGRGRHDPRLSGAVEALAASIGRHPATLALEQLRRDVHPELVNG